MEMPPPRLRGMLRERATSGQEMMNGVPTMHLQIPLDEAGDRRLLRGALLAARGSELAEMQRRGLRLSAGYGTESAREGMTAEVAQARRRLELIDRLIAALDAGADSADEV